MKPEFLRSLQAQILADEDCAPFVHTPEMDVIDGTEAAAKDQRIADILNGKSFGAGSTDVPVWWAKKLLIKRGKWRGITVAAADSGHPAVEAAFAAVALAEDDRMTANFTSDSAGPLMAALVGANLLDDDDVAGLKALCATPSAITCDQVSRALRGPWGDE